MRITHHIVTIVFIFNFIPSASVSASESDVFLNSCRTISTQDLQSYKDYVKNTAASLDESIDNLATDYEVISREEDDSNYLIRVKRQEYGVVNYIFNRDFKNEDYYLKQIGIEKVPGQGVLFEFYSKTKDIQRYYEYLDGEIEGAFVEFYENGNFRLILYAKDKKISGCNMKFNQDEIFVEVADRQ